MAVALYKEGTKTGSWIRNKRKSHNRSRGTYIRIRDKMGGRNQDGTGAGNTGAVS